MIMLASKHIMTALVHCTPPTALIVRNVRCQELCLALSSLVCFADSFYLTLIGITRTSAFPYELLHPHEYPVTETEVPGTSWWSRMGWLWFVSFGSAVLVNPVHCEKFWNGIYCDRESWSLHIYG